MQNLDWNKCFQQVPGVELHFPFVRGLAVGLYWGCLRPTTQRAAQPGAPWARLTERLLGRVRQAQRSHRNCVRARSQFNAGGASLPRAARRTKFSHPKPKPLAARGEASESALAEP